MRLALALLIAAGGGIALVFVLTAKDEGPPPDLQRQRGGSEMPSVVRPPSSGPLEVAGAHGTNVFTPRSATATIDEGEEVPYGALLVWCARFDAITDDRFRVEDVRVIMNDKPLTREDLGKHVVIPPQTRPEHIGDLLSDAMGRRASGIRAATALFEGGRDLETASKISMQGGVTVHLRDPRDPDRKGKIECESMQVELDHGRIVQGSTEGPVSITTADGVIRGRGLSFVTETGVLRIDHDISGALKDLQLGDRTGLPASLTAKGPLLYRPKSAPDNREALRPVGSFEVENDVVIEQGAYAIGGQKLKVRTRKGRPAIESLDLEGAVTVTAPEGVFAGGLVTWTQADGERARLVLSGAPVKATLKDAARALPGIGAQGDLDLSTDGEIVFDGVDLPEGEERKISIGPAVTMTSHDGARVDARSVQISLRHVASNRADKPAADTELYPVKVVLDGRVRGQGSTGSFSCGKLEYERTIATDGRPTRDRVTLSQGPVLRYLPSSAGADAEDGETGRVRDLLSGNGPLQLRAENTITVALDPLRTGPIEAEARGAVRMQRFDPEDPDLERGRLGAEEIDLVLVERFAPDLDAVGVRVKTTRRARRAAARRDVRLWVPDRIEGQGDVLIWDGDAGDLRLMRPVAKPALVVVTDGEGRKQTLRAPSLLYRQATRVVEATGGVHATVKMPTIAYGGGRSKESVETEVRAAAVTAWLNTPGQGSGLVELLAQGDVTVKQESGAGIGCDLLRVDLIRDETVVRGRPARLDFVRVENGKLLKEWIIAPSMVSANGEAMLGGPVQARLHSRSKGLAMKVAGERREAARPTTMISIDIVAEQDLCLSEARLQARGPAVITQGDPSEDGFRLDGERIVLFLKKPESNDGSPTKRFAALRALDVTRAVVKGAVSFVSPELEGKGDVIEFDRDEKVITLYRHRGNAALLWQGQWQIPRPRFDLHLRDPDNPRVISTLSPPDRGNR